MRTDRTYNVPIEHIRSIYPTQLTRVPLYLVPHFAETSTAVIIILRQFGIWLNYDLLLLWSLHHANPMLYSFWPRPLAGGVSQYLLDTLIIADFGHPKIHILGVICNGMKRCWKPNSPQIGIFGHPFLKSWLKPCSALVTEAWGHPNHLWCTVLEVRSGQTTYSMHQYDANCLVKLSLIFFFFFFFGMIKKMSKRDLWQVTVKWSDSTNRQQYLGGEAYMGHSY